MRPVTTSASRIIAVFICELGCLFLIGAIASNAWQVHKDGNHSELRVGLWESCSAPGNVGSKKEINCDNHSAGGLWINLVRALLIIGATCQLPPFALVLYFGPQNRKRMLFLLGLTGLAALLCSCGLVFYIIKVREPKNIFGWSFYLAWVAIVFDLIGTIVAGIGYKLKEDSYIRVEHEVGLLEKDPFI